MTFSLSESMRRYIDNRVHEGGYATASEYLRDLIRRDQQHHAAGKLRELISEGARSGHGRTVDGDVVASLRDQAFRGA